MSYKVKLPVFEGPFDLLVYLIQNARMSIYDIEISEITAQYMKWIKRMEETNFEVASEFMVLAATLLKIKSEMILPKPETEWDGQEVEDPRDQLVEKIIEYKKAKYGAELLDQCFEDNQKIYTKPAEDISMYLDNPEEYLSLDMPKFVKAFQDFMERKLREEEVRMRYVTVEKERETVNSRMKYINSRLEMVGKQGIALNYLVPDGGDRYDLVISFISVLQLVRDNKADVEQNSLFGRIIVRPTLFAEEREGA